MKQKIIATLNCKNLLVLCTGIFVCSIFTQLYVSNRLAVKGKEMVELDNEKQALLKEISELKLEESKFASLSFVETRATELGFEPMQRYVSVIAPDTSTAVLTSF